MEADEIKFADFFKFPNLVERYLLIGTGIAGSNFNVYFDQKQFVT